MVKANTGHRTGLAVLWMMLALACFCLLAIASRELTASLGTLEILFWRSLIGLVIVTALLLRAGGLASVRMPPQLMGWHLLRNSSHFAGQCAWLIAIAALPLAEVFALEFTTPLWAALLAALFMGESLNRGRWFTLVLGLLGVLLILRPGAAVINPASLIMLAGAVGFGINVIATRRLTQLLGNTLLLVCVDLGEEKGALVLVGDLFQQGHQDLAGFTPVRPEVHHHGTLVGLLDQQGCCVSFVDVDYVFGHWSIP